MTKTSTTPQKCPSLATGQAGNRMSGGMKTKAVLIAATLLALAGCNTVAGVGEDIAGGARTVQTWF